MWKKEEVEESGVAMTTNSLRKAALLTLKMKEGGPRAEEGCWSWRSWKKHENEFSSRTSREKCNFAGTVSLAQSDSV